MGALADLLSKHASSGEGDAPESDDGGDSRAMGVASLKAMFEAAKKGDYEQAYDHLCAATEHAKNEDYGDEEGGGMGKSEGSGPHVGLMLIPKGK